MDDVYCCECGDHFYTDDKMDVFFDLNLITPTKEHIGERRWLI